MSRLTAMLSDTYPEAQVQVFNLCQGGSEVGFVDHILNQRFLGNHLLNAENRTVDLVLMDYSVNDVASPPELRTMHEKIIRRLLSMGNVPIVYLAGGKFGDSERETPRCLGKSSCIDPLTLLMRHYNLPVISYAFVNDALRTLENQSSSTNFGRYINL